jgi:hypothetical protein
LKVVAREIPEIISSLVLKKLRKLNSLGAIFEAQVNWVIVVGIVLVS